MKKTLFAVLAASCFLVACGDDDDSSPDARILPPDAAAMIDARPAIDAAAACTLATSITAPAAMTGQYVCATGGAQVACTGTNPNEGAYVEMFSELNSDALPDILDLQFYKMSSFTLGPGTYSLTATREANYETCAVCVLAYTNIDTSSGDPVDTYFQTAGTMVITAVTAGVGPLSGTTPATVTGSLSGVTLHQVTINSSTYQSTLVGSCESDLTDIAAFTGSVVEDPM